jgi:hypothetical protein
MYRKVYIKLMFGKGCSEAACSGREHGNRGLGLGPEERGFEDG